MTLLAIGRFRAVTCLRIRCDWRRNTLWNRAVGSVSVLSVQTPTFYWGILVQFVQLSTEIQSSSS